MLEQLIKIMTIFATVYKLKKTNMKKITLFFILMSFCFGFYGHAKVVKRSPKKAEKEIVVKLSDFFKNYATNFVKNHPLDSLLSSCMPKNLISDLERMEEATDCDPILRVQDFSEDLLKSLKVEDCGKDWYKIKYIIRDKDTVNVPLKAVLTKGKLNIIYVTPEWHGNKIGDSLYVCKNIPKNIDCSDGLKFVKSFFEAYAFEYCRMPEDLQARLDVLRERYCTNIVLSRIDIASENEGSPLYDLLIGNYDFDALMMKSVTCNHLKDNWYRITYSYMDSPVSLDYQIEKQGKNFVITDVKIAED